MKYIMGLDIGISSIGWAVINLEKMRIEDLGVRLFPAAENPKDGGSVNKDRRMARGLRRRLKRKRIRMNRIKDLFLKYRVLTKEEREQLYQLKKENKDIWELRAEGLDRQLTRQEWCRVLTAIAKRRGYKSNRKIEAQSDEGGRILKSIALNKSYMDAKGYRTIGEMFARDEKYKENKRNKQDQYNNCVERVELEKELKLLFEKQREYKNEFASRDFEEEYLQVFNYQKPFMSAELMEKMVGKCTFEKGEPRASKNSWTFERFMLLQKVNNLSYQIDGKKYYLNEEQRGKIIELAYELKSGIKYTRIRKILELPQEAIFTGLNYYYRTKKNKNGEYEKLSEEEIRKKVEDKIFVELKGYHEIKTVLQQKSLYANWEGLIADKSKLDDMAESLTRNKTDLEIKEDLKTKGVEDEIAEAVLKVNFTKFGHLSYKAMNQILPFLEEGWQYDKACEMAGYNFKNDDENPRYKLPVISKEEIRNPVVYRSVTQTRKVINAVIDRYGSPYEIHIEMARDLTRNFKDRKDIERRQEQNRAENENLKKDLQEHFSIKAKPVDLLKKKLYHEQAGKSAYSLNPIDYNRLFENGYVEIDHAIPFSRSFDDSYHNKVLVLSKENQEKRNRTPYEYLGNNEKWDLFEAWVKSTYRSNMRKRENLLVKNFDEDKSKEWQARNLNDTKYIARYMLNFIKQNLKFEDYGEDEKRIKVKTIEGAATTALRHYWGIRSKNREKDDLHHAEDAVIIACATEKFQRKIREYSKEKELYYLNKNGNYIDPETGEIVDVKYKSHEMVRPWPNFKEELEIRMSQKEEGNNQNPVLDLIKGKFSNYDDVEEEKLNPIFVSRMPNRKINGQVHKETIYSNRFKKKGENNIVTVKKALNRISRKEIEMVVLNEACKELYVSDKDTYDRIYKRLKEYDFKAEKAFSDEFVFRKNSAKGESPIIRSIKIPSTMGSGVEVQKGIAENGGIARVDIFEKDGKFYTVPIYIADMKKEKLPSKVVKAKKNENEWIEIDASYQFKFSICYNDLLRIKKKGKEEIYGYYTTMDRSTAAITILKHDGSKEYRGIGIQNLECFEKYEVDILGNYHKVKKEKRKGGKK